MRWSQLCLAVLFSSLSTSLGWADIPAPQPKPTSEMKFVVEVDPNVKQPRLIVPRQAMTRNAALEPDTIDGIGALEPRGLPHTLIASTALTLAIGCGGLWLVRRNRSGIRGVALLLVAGSLFAGGAWVWANAPAPRRPVPLPAPALYSGKVSVEVAPQGDTITLIVTQDMLNKLSNPAGAAPGAPPNGPPNAPAAPPKPE